MSTVRNTFDLRHVKLPKKTSQICCDFEFFEESLLTPRMDKFWNMLSEDSGAAEDETFEGLSIKVSELGFGSVAAVGGNEARSCDTLSL